MTTRRCLVCGRTFPAPTGRGRPPQTCSKTCAMERKTNQREESRERTQQRGIPPHMHGTCTGASHYRCTCPKCRKWWREYQAKRRTPHPAPGGAG